MFRIFSLYNLCFIFHKKFCVLNDTIGNENIRAHTTYSVIILRTNFSINQTKRFLTPTFSCTSLMNEPFGNTVFQMGHYKVISMYLYRCTFPNNFFWIMIYNMMIRSTNSSISHFLFRHPTHKWIYCSDTVIVQT